MVTTNFNAKFEETLVKDREQEFSKHLNDLLFVKGITKKRLAKEFNIDASSLFLTLRGARRWTLARAVAVCGLLDVSIDEFFKIAHFADEQSIYKPFTQSEQLRAKYSGIQSRFVVKKYAPLFKDGVFSEDKVGDLAKELYEFHMKRTEDKIPFPAYEFECMKTVFKLRCEGVGMNRIAQVLGEPNYKLTAIETRSINNLLKRGIKL